jgi:hypothetical protein
MDLQTAGGKRLEFRRYGVRFARWRYLEKCAIIKGVERILRMNSN